MPAGNGNWARPAGLTLSTTEEARRSHPGSLLTSSEEAGREGTSEWPAAPRYSLGGEASRVETAPAARQCLPSPRPDVLWALGSDEVKAS